MKIVKYIASAFMAVVCLGSCSKDLLDTTPYDAVSSDQIWSTTNLATLAVNGMYNALLQNAGTSYTDSDDSANWTLIRCQVLTRQSVPGTTGPVRSHFSTEMRLQVTAYSLTRGSSCMKVSQGRMTLSPISKQSKVCLRLRETASSVRRSSSEPISTTDSTASTEVFLFILSQPL